MQVSCALAGGSPLHRVEAEGIVLIPKRKEYIPICTFCSVDDKLFLCVVYRSTITFTITFLESTENIHKPFSDSCLSVTRLS